MDLEENKTPVRETSSPVPENEIEKEEANIEATPLQQITMDTETEEELQVAEEIQAREEEIEEEAEEITEEERVTQQLKETDEPVTTVEEEEEDDDEDEEEGEEETQCLSQKNNSDHQYFSGDFGKIQTKETGETEKDSEDDDEEGDDEEEEQSQVEPSSLIAPAPAASAQELDVMTHSNINLDHPLGEDEEEDEEEEEEDDERDDASEKDSPTVVIELGSEGEEEEEEEDDGEEEEADEVDDDELDSMSQRSEVTDDSETYDMTRGNLGLLEQAIALKAEQNGRSSEESCSPEQQRYHSPEERMSKAMDIAARRAYYGKGDRKCLFQPTLIVTLYDLN